MSGGATGNRCIGLGTDRDGRSGTDRLSSAPSGPASDRRRELPGGACTEVGLGWVRDPPPGASDCPSHQPSPARPHMVSSAAPVLEDGGCCRPPRHADSSPRVGLRRTADSRSQDSSRARDRVFGRVRKARRGVDAVASATTGNVAEMVQPLSPEGLPARALRPAADLSKPSATSRDELR